jgi:hypothetical protein
MGVRCNYAFLADNPCLLLFSTFLKFQFGVLYNSSNSYTLSSSNSYSGISTRGADWNVQLPLPKVVPVKGSAGVGGSWSTNTTRTTTLGSSTTVATGQSVQFQCKVTGNLSSSESIIINGFSFPQALLPACATITIKFASGNTYVFTIKTSITSAYNAYGLLYVDYIQQ